MLFMRVLLLTERCRCCSTDADAAAAPLQPSAWPPPPTHLLIFDLSLPSPIEELKQTQQGAGTEGAPGLAHEQDPQVVIRRSLDLARALQTVGTETLTGLSSNSKARRP